MSKHEKVTKRILLQLLLAGIAHACVGAEHGERLAERCNECHGPGGRSENPQVPSIGGFTEFAIMDLLELYASGQRPARPAELADGTETDMNEIVQALTVEEIEAVGIYYSQQQWQPHAQAFDAALARRGAVIHARKCAKCHPKGGSVPEVDLALTAGQWREYLEAEFRNFDAGTRPMTAKMQRKYETLSAADKKAVLEFYVSAGNF